MEHNIQNKERLFWLTGSYFKRREIIRDIKENISDYVLHVYGEEVSGSYIEEQIMENSLFSVNKIVILNSIPRFSNNTTSDNKKIIQMFSNAPSNCFIIMNGISSSERPSLYKLFSSMGKTIEAPLYLSRKEAITWVSDRFDQNNKKVNSSMFSYVVDSAGAEENGKGVDVDRLFLCLQKILMFAGKNSKISNDDIFSICQKHSNFFAWGNSGIQETDSLFGALDNKSFLDASLVIKRLVAKEGAMAAAQQIIPLLSWRYRLIFLAKEANHKKNITNVSDYIQNSFIKFQKEDIAFYVKYTPEKNKDGEDVPYYTQGAINGVVRGFYNKLPTMNLYNRENLYKIMRCIYEVASKIRTNKISDIEILVLLDHIILTITSFGSFSEEEYRLFRRLTDERA